MEDRPEYIITAAELGSVVGLSKLDVCRAFDTTRLCKLPGYKVGIPPQLVRQNLAARGVDYSLRVVAHINLNGGIGKTTSTISVATRALQYG